MDVIAPQGGRAARGQGCGCRHDWHMTGVRHRSAGWSLFLRWRAGRVGGMTEACGAWHSGLTGGIGKP